MKAVLVTRTGDPSVLEYVDLATPLPQTGEVLVKADTIGVNRPELLVREGTYGWMSPLPVIPGIEMSGTVADIGEGVVGYTPGDKVFVNSRLLRHRAGCYAEYIVVPEVALSRLPAHVDLQAAAALSSYQVAYHLVHAAAGEVTGKTALIDAASGGISSAAVQLARLAGAACVIALVGSDEKARALKEFGADSAINSRAENVARRVWEITRDKGVDLILNATGSDSLNNRLRFWLRSA